MPSIRLSLSPALAALDRMSDSTSLEVTRLIRRAALVMAEAAPELDPADLEAVLDVLDALALLRERTDDGLVSPARLAAELEDRGRADLAATVRGWTLAAVWALEDERAGGAVALAAEAGPHPPIGRPRKPPR